jgi:glutathione peroxidase
MNTEKIAPTVPFYSLSATKNNGENQSFDWLQGKHVLIVNLASNCGFTGQYEELEALYKKHQDKLVILGFPANNFGGQEPGSDAEIASFCQLNFGVTFPLFKKASVKGNDKQPVYEWLSNPAKNGWNREEPSWNFFKYLVDDKGVLLQTFSSAVSPLSEDITKYLL